LELLDQEFFEQDNTYWRTLKTNYENDIRL